MTAIEEAGNGDNICRWFLAENSSKLLCKLHGAVIFAESDDLEDELDFLFEFEMTRREMALEAKHEL